MARRPGIRWRRIGTVLLATWFITLSAIRLESVLQDPFVDIRLYLRASSAWLTGGDPWSVRVADAIYSAAPPSLVVFAPFTIVPELVAVGILLVLGLAASLWTLRRLGLPLWWITWPPLVDNLANGNPQIFLVPLLLGAVPWLAPLVKIYAVVPLVIQLRLRSLVCTGAVLLLSVPLLPWSDFLARSGATAATLSELSRGGMSAWVLPAVLIPIGVVALIALGRRRAAWWFLPVLWPATQWYYALMAMPALTPLSAAILAVPIQGLPVLAASVLAIETAFRHRYGWSWEGGRAPQTPGSPPASTIVPCRRG